MSYLSDDDTVIWTSDDGNMRIRAVRDMSPGEPEDYSAMPTLRISNYAYHTSAEFIRAEDIGTPDGDDLESAYRRFCDTHGNGRDVFLRWLRIFHGCTTDYSYGPSQSTDYQYLTFDTAEWRAAHEIADTAELSACDDFAEYRHYLEGDAYGVILEHRVNRMVTTYDHVTGEQEDSEVQSDWVERESVWGFYTDDQEELTAHARWTFGVEDAPAA